MLNILKKNYSNINSIDALSSITEEDTLIIDVREPYEYSAGHIPKAKNIPLSIIQNKIKDIDKNKKIILVCASGSRSAHAAKLLGNLGYKVFNLTGGMMLWTGLVVR